MLVLSRSCINCGLAKMIQIMNNKRWEIDHSTKTSGLLKWPQQLTDRKVILASGLISSMASTLR